MPAWEWRCRKNSMQVMKMKFRTRLRQLRTERKLSQKELGKELHLGTSAISMYERGEREPDFEKVGMIADFFNVSIDYLLGKSDIQNPNNAQSLFGEDIEVTDEMWEKIKEYANYVKFAYGKKTL